MWSVRDWDEMETGNRVIFRSRPRLPHRSRCWFMFPPPTIPTQNVLFPSRPFPAPLSVHLFPSPPDLRVQFAPSRSIGADISISFTTVPVFSLFHHVVVVLTLTRIIKSVVTGQAPVTLELRNTPGKNTHNPRWYTHISQLT